MKMPKHLLSAAVAVLVSLAPMVASARDSGPSRPVVKPPAASQQTVPQRPAAPRPAAAAERRAAPQVTAPRRPAQARPAAPERRIAKRADPGRAGTQARAAERARAPARVAETRPRPVQVARAAPGRRVAGVTPVSLRGAAAGDSAALAESPTDLVLRSSAVLVMDERTNQPLFSRNSDQLRPIASITKLMTAMVVLDYNQPLDEPITITEEDVQATRRLSSRLAPGTTLTRAEMLRLSLMSSENRATAALARTSPGGMQEFIAQMNLKARTLGMRQSRFTDPTGLDNTNVSTAAELITLVRAGLEYPLIREYTTTPQLVVETPGNRAAQLAFHNSNFLVSRPDWEIDLSKTGFIRDAGRCLVMHARINGEPVIIVLLDSHGRFTRIGDANRIRRWIESGFLLALT
jgi:D-alanyl-D-alanine endopeptidase (penicillin-binding protein 7)